GLLVGTNLIQIVPWATKASPILRAQVLIIILGSQFLNKEWIRAALLGEIGEALVFSPLDELYLTKFLALSRISDEVVLAQVLISLGLVKQAFGTDLAAVYNVEWL